MESGSAGFCRERRRPRSAIEDRTFSKDGLIQAEHSHVFKVRSTDESDAVYVQ
jgi:hypothetical protein